jgi:predicted MPP superfamily phosphohydrolase
MVRPRRVLCVGVLAGAAGLGYAVAETRRFVLRHVTVPVLPAGHRALRVLHLSDLHLTPWQRLKRDWVSGLAGLEPDLVVNTGDNLAHLRAVPSVVESLGPLLDVPGVFVLGSNDYYAPVLKNPAGYLMPDRGRRTVHSARLPVEELRAGLGSGGWVDLSNRRDRLKVGDSTLAFVGVDDPHLGYDDLAAVAGPAEDADLAVGVTHAPYLRVLDRFAADGYRLVFAGHTHGGQLCLPVTGALVTNCDLDTARAKGLHRHPADSSEGDPGSSWLHVSAGLGTSPYAPVRFCCRPEATLLELTARADFGGSSGLG